MSYEDRERNYFCLQGKCGVTRIIREADNTDIGRLPRDATHWGMEGLFGREPYFFWLSLSGAGRTALCGSEVQGDGTALACRGIRRLKR